MSTRCVVRLKQKIGNKNVKIDLYHHHDGYPTGVGADLVEMFYDKEKAFYNLDDICDVANFLLKKEDDEYQITVYNHVDIEYLYIIDIDKKDIKCQAVLMNWETGKIRSKKDIDLLKEVL